MQTNLFFRNFINRVSRELCFVSTLCNKERSTVRPEILS